MFKLASRGPNDRVNTRRRARLALALMMLGVLMAGPLGALGAVDEAAAAGCGEAGCVDIVEVVGLIDPIVADLITDAIDDASSGGGVVAIVLQMDSPGSVLDEARFERLARSITGSRVPVSVWVGPSGAEVRGGAAELALLATEVTLAPGSSIGEVGRTRTPEPQGSRVLEGARGELADSLVDAERAAGAGIARTAPVVLEHVARLPNVVSDEVATEDGKTALQPRATGRFSSLPLFSQLMHTVASPAVAYLLFSIGLALLLFEFFTAGIGVAGVTGAGCLLLGAYGIAVLPHTAWGLGLMVFSAFGFAVDIQTGVPRVWTGIAMASFIVGSFTLFSEFRPGWAPLVVGIAGMALAMISGMPSMVRTRFGTPTIGRDWMVGELAEVVSDVDPDGVVVIRGASWRARTNRATPVLAGSRARVVSIDGLLLEVEPEEGGARDHRERRRGTAQGDDADS